jgi:hypothetical protein
MPAYNFQKQFVPMILDGSKHHTVRPRRKRPTVPGDKLMLYTGMRTKQCELIAISQCASVVPIQIFPESGDIVLDGRRFTEQNISMFAAHDGFDDPREFFRFFERYSARVRENDLATIYWDTGKLFMPVMGTHGEIKVW